MNVYLNIETIPPIGSRPDPARVRIPKNIKDEVKKELRRVEGARDAWERLALQPWTAQISVVTILTEDAEEPALLMHFDEKYLLTCAESVLRELVPATYVTFNGLRFDFGMLKTHAVKHGLRDLAAYMSCPKWGDSSHIDVFQYLGAEGDLDEWADFYKVKNDNPISGAEMATCFEQGRTDEIVRHAKSRVTALRDIYRKIIYCGGP